MKIKSKYQIYIIAVWIINFAIFMGRYSYGTVIKDIEESMVASGMVGDTAATEASLATTYLFLTYAIGQMAYTFLSRKVNPKNVVFVSILISAICTLFVPILPLSFSKWLWLVNGLPHAVLYVSSMGVLSSFLPKEKMLSAGSAMGSVMPAAQLTLYILAAFIGKIASWRWIFYIATFLMFLAAILWFFVYRALEKMPKYEDCKGEYEERKKNSNKLFFGIFVTLCMSALLCVVVKNLASVWTIKILETEYNVDSSWGYLLVGVMMTVSTVSVKLTKLLAKLIKNYCLLNIYQLIILSVLGFIVSRFSLSTWVFYGMLVMISTLAFSITNISAFFGPFAYRSYMSADVSGGWVNAISCFGASFASLLAGIIMDRGDYHRLFIVIFIVALICMIPMAIGAILHKKLLSKEKLNTFGTCK